MSEPIPESIPTSADPRSKRPTKKRALTPRTALSSQVDALFANPDRPIALPSSTANPSLPPEIVANVQGSSAGAGSGEFHVYKASRRREYARLAAMDEEVRREEDEREYAQRKAEMEKRDREKTEKNRGKREKARLRKERAKAAKREGSERAETPGVEAVVKRKLVPKEREVGGDDGVENEGGEVKDAEEIGLVIEDDE